MFPDNLARIRNLKFENVEIGQSGVGVVEVKLRVYSLKIIDCEVTLQPPDRMGAPRDGHLRITDRDPGRTFSTQSTRTVCSLRRVRHLDSNVFDVEVGAWSDNDWSAQIEIDISKFDAPFNRQPAFVPVSGPIIDNSSILQGRERLLRGHRNGQGQHDP